MNYSNSQRAGIILYLTASLFGGYRQSIFYENNVMIEKPSENEVFPDGEFIMDHFDLILIFN